MTDKRIGHNDKFPETTINGAQYTRPVSTIVLGDGYFAVLDIFGNTPEQIDELKQLVQQTSKRSKRSKASDDDIQTADD